MTRREATLLFLGALTVVVFQGPLKAPERPAAVKAGRQRAQIAGLRRIYGGQER